MVSVIVDGVGVSCQAVLWRPDWHNLAGSFSAPSSGWHTVRFLLVGVQASGWIDGEAVFTNAVLPTEKAGTGFLAIGTGRNVMLLPTCGVVNCVTLCDSQG